MRIILLAFLLCLLNVQHASAEESACQKVKPFVTEINVEILTPPPVYDLTKNIAFLNKDGGKASEEWIKKNGLSGIWMAKDMQTQGTAAGGWGAFTGYELDAKPLDAYGAYGCIYFKKIEVSMMFRTLIMIPKEYPKGTCAYNLINDHELKHYQVNQATVNEVTDRLKKDIPQIIAQLESVHVGSDKMQARATEMKTAFTEMIDVYFKQVMTEKLEERNSLVDTPEEYQNISMQKKACNKVRK